MIQFSTNYFKKCRCSRTVLWKTKRLLRAESIWISRDRPVRKGRSGGLEPSPPTTTLLQTSTKPHNPNNTTCH